MVVSECKPKAKIVDICEKGDAFIREYDDFQFVLVFFLSFSEFPFFFVIKLFKDVFNAQTNWKYVQECQEED